MTVRYVQAAADLADAVALPEVEGRYLYFHLWVVPSLASELGPDLDRPHRFASPIENPLDGFGSVETDDVHVAYLPAANVVRRMQEALDPFQRGYEVNSDGLKLVPI